MSRSRDRVRGGNFSLFRPGLARREFDKERQCLFAAGMTHRLRDIAKVMVEDSKFRDQGPQLVEPSAGVVHEGQQAQEPFYGSFVLLLHAIPAAPVEAGILDVQRDIRR